MNNVSSRFRLTCLVAISSLASTAHAQSSVTLYGLIDAGLMYTNSVKRGASSGPLFQATSGNINGSQFGVRGREELGGGLNAVFALENGFNVLSGKLGQDNRLFGRLAFVGIGSSQFGTTSIGRQYDEGVDDVAPLSAEAPFFGKMGFAHPFDNDNLDDSLRIGNSIKYTSPNLSGLQFGGLYAFSNSTAFSGNRAYSLGTQYARGPLKLALSYLQINGSNSSNTAGAVDPLESTANGTGGFLLSSDVERVTATGINYAVGHANFGFVYSHSQYEGTTMFGSSHGTVTFDNFEVNALYALTPSLQLGAAYVYTDGSVTKSSTYGSDPKWNQIEAQAVYSLSKRTDIYLEAMYQHVSGRQFVAFINTAGGAAAGPEQVATTVGIRTRF
ncbi:porin [Paraburkholderia xenovorans]|uniref:porin n=1 Tax=Paraburkholderia xenovorans TaxID=36873 RepID=UPI0038BA6777